MHIMQSMAHKLSHDYVGIGRTSFSEKELRSNRFELVWLNRRIYASKQYNRLFGQKGRLDMEEKVYKVMGGSGAWNIALGVIAITVGIVSGVLLIISGAKLLANRTKIIF